MNERVRWLQHFPAIEGGIAGSAQGQKQNARDLSSCRPVLLHDKPGQVLAWPASYSGVSDERTRADYRSRDFSGNSGGQSMTTKAVLVMMSVAFVFSEVLNWCIDLFMLCMSALGIQ